MAGFKLSMLTSSERKTHNARIKKINSLIKQGEKVAKIAIKRNNS